MESKESNMSDKESRNKAGSRMSHDEMLRISFGINLMAGPQLAKVIEIIQRREQPENDDPDEFMIDFEKLQQETLRELEKFVNDYHSKHRGPNWYEETSKSSS